MSNCVAQERLLQLIAGQLDARESLLISQHLTECLSCQSAADALTDDVELREFLRCHRDQQEPDDVVTAGLKDGGERGAPARTMFGRFRLKHRLGSGGFGFVYLAEDTQLHREVALKIPRAAALADPDAHDRFLREVRAAAGLHHPQIVAVFDAGQCDGTYYLASAYCPGPTLGQWMRDQGHGVKPDLAAKIVLALAEATQHAHENGVLHRDIKPQNVLLDPTRRYRDLPFSPQLTDFSVAKLMNGQDDATASHVLVGTPRYMAPEQVSGRRDLLGPRCDVYALGAVLYELLTGQPLVQGDDNADTLRRVLSDEPIAPRKIVSAVPLDLEAICQSCVQKLPERRYATAKALADDLDRFLARRPTVARPMPPWEHAVRWTMRHPARATVLGGGILAALLTLIGLLLYNARLNDFNAALAKFSTDLAGALEESKRAEAKSTASENRTQLLLYVADMRLANRARRDGDVHTLSQLLMRHVPAEGQPDRRGLEWWFLRGFSELNFDQVARHPHAIYYLRISPDGRQLAACGQESIVRIHDLASGTLTRAIDTRQVEVNSVAFSSAGDRLATAGDDGSVCVWRLDDGTCALRFKAHAKLVFGVTYAANDELLVSCGNDPTLRLWDARTGAERGTLGEQDKGYEALAIAPDGRRLASAGSNGRIKVWDVAGRQELCEIRNQGRGFPVSSVAFAPQGGWLAAGDIEDTLGIWDASRGRPMATARLLDAVHAVAISPDGRLLVSGDAVGGLSLWNTQPVESLLAQSPQEPADLMLVRRWTGHSGRINGLTFDGDGQLLSAGVDGVIRRWDCAAIVQSKAFENKEARWHYPSFTSSGRPLAIVPEREIVAWNLSDQRQLKAGIREPSQAAMMRLDPSGAWIATSTVDGELEVFDSRMTDEDRWDGSSPILGQRRKRWSIGAGLDIRNLGLSPDGQTLAVLVRQPRQEVRLYETATGQLRTALPLTRGTVGKLAYSPDGTRVAASVDNDVWIWSPFEELEPDKPAAQAGRVRRISKTHLNFAAFAFNPQGSVLATCGSDRLIKFWDAHTGEELGRLVGHRGSVHDVRFSHDGRTLLSVGADRVIKAWNVAAREELFDLHEHKHRGLDELTLSPDGRYLLACTFYERKLLLLDLGERNPTSAVGR